MSKRISFIEHDKPVFYSEEYRGLIVVHSEKDNTVIVGGMCEYYNDAYTNIMRYEIPTEKLNSFVQIDKQNLDKYDFLELSNLGSFFAYRVVKKSDYTYLNILSWHNSKAIIKSWDVNNLTYL